MKKVVELFHWAAARDAARTPAQHVAGRLHFLLALRRIPRSLRQHHRRARAGVEPAYRLMSALPGDPRESGAGCQSL